MVKLALKRSLIVFLFCGLTSFAASLNGHDADIEKLLKQMTSELQSIQQDQSTNWQAYFKTKANERFTTNDYPSWQGMQGDLMQLQGQLTHRDLSSAALADLYNPEVATEGSRVDTASLKLAESVMQQVAGAQDANSQSTTGSAQAMQDAVSIPLGDDWHRDLTSADEVQVLKALSAQVAVSNALAFERWQQAQNEQLLLARLLVELTQLNQSLQKLQSAKN
ncbi:MAG: hypothetical protein EBX40_00830 [Gammaproteobacteria bacterium]|nr:hypothetical protein [Gammaproteobacteria bacterium]